MIRSLATLLMALPLAAAAQDYPSKPIRMIVPYTAGGAADTVARSIGNKLGELLGQPIVIENRTGAGGIIGTDFVAKSAPDGYTLVSTLGPSHHTIQFFSKNVPYDPVKDFTAVMLVGTAPQTLVVPASLPVSSMTELVEYAKRNAGKVSFGTSGVGTSQHLGGLLLNNAAGIDMVHVPYKGGAAALNDVLGAQVQVGLLVLSNVLPHIRAGKLRALGVLEAKRAKGAPSIPTVAEAGIAGYAIPDTWAGILGPAGIPAPVLSRLSAELTKAVNSPDVLSRLEGAGFEVVGSSPKEFGDLLAGSVDTYRRIVTRAGIKPE
jgi:tripartite-type tricarboxylate transporter receptor subunit TctC